MRTSDTKPGDSPRTAAQRRRNRETARKGRPFKKGWPFKKGLLAAVPAFFVFFALWTFLSSWERFNTEPTPVSGAERALARSAWSVSGGTKARPWPDAPELQRPSIEGPLFTSSVRAASAIVIDGSNGTVLFEKDADALIPPASMTKLVAMYAAFRAMDAGELAPDEIIEPPEASWAERIPPHSSLMFLGKGQRLTVDELLRGMAVVSGNDAAVALAIRVSGSVEGFVARMNGEMSALGLARTRFVEPSGLSEKNLTTAREFADFAKTYVAAYPQALARYHSVAALTYPETHNLPAPGAGSTNTNPILAGLVPISQRATNPLLGDLEGCDGLKTGYIDESGYNLSLTAERDGTRFISVTLGGPGDGVAEGNRFRQEDGRALMEWAFLNWKTERVDGDIGFPVVVWGGRAGRIYAIAAGGEPLTVPKASKGPYLARARLPAAVRAPVQAGDELGTVEWIDSSGTVVASQSAIADRNSPTAGIAARIGDVALRGAAGLMGLE